ncbi:MAG TPA: S8 family serine peptidase [Kineosporiaceae bacterium]|nr:S8 family serine peptidase [Kineosporiaceae bacterium]
MRLTATADKDAVRRQVGALGGSIIRFQESLHTVVLTVPASKLARLTAVPGVTDVVADSEVAAQSLGFAPESNPGAMTNVTRITGATEMWKKGYTGKGIDVAVIDTGIAPVSGLLDPNKVIIGPDLSFESQDVNTRYLDTYGHGTNMAGIIAGREVAPSTGSAYAADTSNHYGMAPDARLVSLKLADHGGAVDVSQMIAAIDWVVANRWKEGMNIRVLNISYGTISKQNAQADPLSWAAEIAWKLGIVVVASAGNDGDTTVGLASPAYNPWVIAVGAQDTKGTASYTDDTVPSFSERGINGGRGPDVVAPGVGIISLGVPGSLLYETYKSARIGNGFLRGSGTSQSAAVVSGAVALLLQRYVWLTPDDAKAYLMSSATSLAGTSATAQGAGAIDLRKAMATVPAPKPQTVATGNGYGSLESARGGQHVQFDGVDLSGEQDIMGQPWDSSRLSIPAGAWQWDGSFNGSIWTGTGLTADTTTWAGRSWAGKTWQGKTWQGKTWQGKTWQTGTWSGKGWSSSSWSSPVPTPGWAGRIWASAGWN